MAYEKVKAYFEAVENGRYAARLRLHDMQSDTVEHAAQVCGCEPAQIAKTMSFVLKNGTCVLIVAAGDVRVQNAKYKAFFGEKAIMIPWDDVESRIGHAPGGVCPFAVNDGVKVYLDESLRRFETVFIAAGAPNATIELETEVLLPLANAEGWIDVANVPC